MSTGSQENEDIVILDCEDLTSSIVTKGAVSGVIHKQLLDKLTKQIHESVLREKSKRAKRMLDSFIGGSKRDDNFPLNYYISGKRGSGKTTFLEQLEERVKCSDYNDVKIKFLLWYDPSKSFGVPNDLFITVTAALKTRMRKLACEPDRQKEYNSYRYRFCEEKLDKLDKAIVRFSQKKEALSNMSEYRASALSSEDPEMNNNIRENFRESMKLLCELEQADAFVLVIDDVDIRTKQCYNVLEDLRLYLSNDYLIVLMAGDRENNLEHVREKFFKEYDIEYHRADRHGREVRMNSTVSHAAQYFAKLFPVKQQFDLEDLNALLDKNKSMKVILRYKKNDEGDVIEESLKAWLLRIFHVAISEDNWEATTHVNTFLSLPFRNIIQVVEYWTKEGMWDDLECLKPKGLATKSIKVKHRESEQWRREWKIEELVRTAINRSLHDQLSVLLDNYDFDLKDTYAYYALFLKLCQETGDLERGYYLSYEIEWSSQYRFLILVLAANFRRHVMNLGGFLSYWLYGPATVALYGKTLEQFMSMGRRRNSILETQNDIRRSFNEYMQVGKRMAPAQWAKRANMIWCRDYKGHHVHSGVVRIQKSETIEKLWKYLIEGNQDEAHFKKTIALIVSMNKSDGRDNSFYISVYSFLAFILGCVEVCDQAFDIMLDMKMVQNGKNKSENCYTNLDASEVLKLPQWEEQARELLDKLIVQYFPITTCRHPEWQIPVEQEEEQDEIILVPYKRILKHKNTRLDHLITEIIEWYAQIRGSKANKWGKDDISPQSMGKLWSHYYSFWRIVGQASNENIAKKDIFPVQGDNEDKEFSSYLEVFDMATDIFKDKDMHHFEGLLDATDYYEKCIFNFPLTKHFGLDIGEAAEEPVEN